MSDWRKIDWKETWTLEDYIIDLLATGKHESSEFQTMVKIFGADRIDKIWAKYNELKNSSLK